MLHASLVLLSTTLASTASAAILKNYTITVPEGASDHNDPNLLCTPSGWQEIIIFYLANYVAHVATILSFPGESRKSKIRVSVVALLFPVSGLIRGLLTILTFASFGKTDLQKAARAGALCMVVRNQAWRPEPGDIVADAYVEKTKNKSRTGDAAGTSNSFARIRVVDAPWSTVWSVNDTLVVVNPGFSIHGSVDMLPSEEYEFAYVSSDAEFENDFIPEISARKSSSSWSISSIKAAISSCISPPTAPTAISSSYNFVGGLIALVQAIYTSVTLYQTRGDQINQYGYAAFGLTVAPYVLMSIINLIGNIFSPIYSAIYMIETSVMAEARRHGCRFDGVVGKLKEGRGALLKSDIEEVNWVTSAIFEGTGENDQLTVDVFSSSAVNIESSSSQKPVQLVAGDDENIQLSSAGGGAKINEKVEQEESWKFAVAQENSSEDPDYSIGIPSCPLIGKAASGQNELGTRPKPDVYILRASPTMLETRIASGSANHMQHTNGMFWWVILLASALIAIVGGLSHFRAGSSTVAQRAWTMSWLGSDIIAGFTLGATLILRDKREVQENVIGLGVIVWSLTFCAPAIGGFVVVGQMVKEYGSCIKLP